MQEFKRLNTAEKLKFFLESLTLLGLFTYGLISCQKDLAKEKQEFQTCVANGGVVKEESYMYGLFSSYPQVGYKNVCSTPTPVKQYK